LKPNYNTCPVLKTGKNNNVIADVDFQNFCHPEFSSGSKNFRKY